MGLSELVHKLTVHTDIILNESFYDTLSTKQLSIQYHGKPITT